jgi:hypothetical protein
MVYQQDAFSIPTYIPFSTDPFACVCVYNGILW